MFASLKRVSVFTQEFFWSTVRYISGIFQEYSDRNISGLQFRPVSKLKRLSEADILDDVLPGGGTLLRYLTLDMED